MGAGFQSKAWRFERLSYSLIIGTPVVPFCFFLGVSLLQLNSRKKGTLVINGLPSMIGTQLEH